MYKESDKNEKMRIKKYYKMLIKDVHYFTVRLLEVGQFEEK